jgi:hypothetical protein
VPRASMEEMVLMDGMELMDKMEVATVVCLLMDVA